MNLIDIAIITVGGMGAAYLTNFGGFKDTIDEILGISGGCIPAPGHPCGPSGTQGCWYTGDPNMPCPTTRPLDYGNMMNEGTVAHVCCASGSALPFSNAKLVNARCRDPRKCTVVSTQSSCPSTRPFRCGLGVKGMGPTRLVGYLCCP